LLFVVKGVYVRQELITFK